jgi:N-acetylgalactosamine kinase
MIKGQVSGLFSANDLRKIFSTNESNKYLFPFYGEDESILEKKRTLIYSTISRYCEYYSESDRIFILRIPARINLMGVHIDHRGGWCNYVSAPWDTILVGSSRTDDTIKAINIKDEYKDIEFSISDEFPQSYRGNWLHYLKHRSIEKGNWGNYLKAGAFKVQDNFPQNELKGVNLAVGGDISVGSGMSSSSTLVVGVVSALLDINQIDISVSEKITLCGEGEWFVGTRGGCGDHSAIVLGTLNQLTHVGFLPLQYSVHTFPEDLEVFIIQSGIEAKKAAGAREIFNSRIAGYEIALEVYQANNPQYSDRIELLRDLVYLVEKIGLERFYTSLLSVPVKIDFSTLRVKYPDLSDRFDEIVSLYGIPNEELLLRAILLFGVTECARARLFPHYVMKADFSTAGQLMYVSHDGDRVSKWKDKTTTDYNNIYDDSDIKALIEKSKQSTLSDLDQLALAPGAYRCSLAEIDRIVDTCRSLSGVIGASLTGAGLGGAVIALVEKQKADFVYNELQNLGFQQIQRCRPVSGVTYV